MMRPPYILSILAVLTAFAIFATFQPERMPRFLAVIGGVFLIGTFLVGTRKLVGVIRDRHRTRVPPKRYSWSIPNNYLPEILFVAAVVVLGLLALAWSRGWILFSLLIGVILFKDPPSRP